MLSRKKKSAGLISTLKKNIHVMQNHSWRKCYILLKLVENCKISKLYIKVSPNFLWEKKNGLLGCSLHALVNLSILIWNITNHCEVRPKSTAVMKNFVSPMFCPDFHQYSSSEVIPFNNETFGIIFPVHCWSSNVFSYPILELIENRIAKMLC